MIERVNAFKVGERVFPTIEEAQKSEIRALIDIEIIDPSSESTVSGVVDLILKYQDKIIDILTMTPASKPRARKINGGTKKRRSAAANGAGVAVSDLTKAQAT